jgi:hypothetical protein
MADYRRALGSCGKFRTGEFEGRYVVRSAGVAEDAPQLEVAILRDRIVIGSGETASEACLVGVMEQKPGELHARAIEQVHARGWGSAAASPARRKAGSFVDLRLSKGQTFTRMSLASPGEPPHTVIDLVPQN